MYLKLLACLQVGALTRNATDSPSTDAAYGILSDGKWHMITLSSLYDNTRGYAMFVDGKLTAVLNGNETYTGTDKGQLPRQICGAVAHLHKTVMWFV